MNNDADLAKEVLAEKSNALPSSISQPGPDVEAFEKVSKPKESSRTTKMERLLRDLLSE